MMRVRVPDILLGAILGVATLGMGIFAVGFVAGSSQQLSQPRQNQASQDRGNETGHGKQEESLWHWVTNDAAGFFTLCLVIVGSLQLVLFLVQLRIIRESLDDAKIAADAAKDGANAAMLSARASIALQLPIIRIEPDSFGHGDSTDGGVHTEFCFVRFLKFFNLGPTKAFPKEIRYGLTIGEGLPANPRYLATKTFPPNLIFESDPKLASHQPLEFEMPLAQGQWSLICGNRLNLWFYCTFAYEDFMQIRHHAGFCWRWQNVGMGMGWRIDDTPAYNQKT